MGRACIRVRPMNKILIADSLAPIGIERLESAGAVVDVPADEDRPRLAERLPHYDAVVVRSATKMTAELIEAGRPRLRVIGRAGIGVDNIDVSAATDLGVLVVNAPTANLMSATEHTFGLMLAVARKVAAADGALKQHTWNRKAYVGQELYGKTLGIIGFGQIGQRVAARAVAFEMDVIAYDPFLNSDVAKRLQVEPVESLEELVSRVDVLTFHTPLTEQTRGLLDRERLALMKSDALVINCGRGGVIDEPALLEALDAGRIGGAGLDVFANEPLEDFALAAHPKVVATPHIGAQTHEAQERIATETARMVGLALDGSLSVSAVNLPFRPAGPPGEPYLRLAERLGRFAGEWESGGVTEVRVELWGIEESLAEPVTVAAVKGALMPFLGEAVNYVNAQKMARERGIDVARTVHDRPSEFSQLLAVRVRSDEGEIRVAGTLFQNDDLRVVRLGDFPFEFRPEGRLLIIRNDDVPGVVGRLGQLIGDAGVNIAAIHLARERGRKEALSVWALEGEVDSGLLEAVLGLDVVSSARLVDLT